MPCSTSLTLYLPPAYPLPEGTMLKLAIISGVSPSSSIICLPFRRDLELSSEPASDGGGLGGAARPTTGATKGVPGVGTVWLATRPTILPLVESFSLARLE